MSQPAPKIVVEEEPTTFAKALREMASRRHAKTKPALRKFTARLSGGGPVLAIEGASDFHDAAMIFAASAAAPLGHNPLRVCVTDCETGKAEHYSLDF